MTLREYHPINIYFLFDMYVLELLIDDRLIFSSSSHFSTVRQTFLFPSKIPFVKSFTFYDDVVCGRIHLGFFVISTAILFYTRASVYSWSEEKHMWMFKLYINDLV